MGSWGVGELGEAGEGAGARGEERCERGSEREECLGICGRGLCVVV